MGYLYDNLKTVLGGQNPRTGKINSNWSPNLVRCIVISTDFIFVANHIGNPRSIVLDSSLVKDDLVIYTTNGGKGALHNLLSERQLSCLEEIYVDNVFKGLQCVIDLEGYAQKSVNSVSRLRFFGYGDFPGGCLQGLQEVYRNCDVLYSLAKDKNRKIPLTFNEVSNPKWYKHYNLRPQYYKIDSDNGSLAIHFRRNEKKIEDLLVGLSEAQKSEGFINIGSKLVEMDLSNEDVYHSLLKLTTYANNRKSSDELCRIFCKELSIITSKLKPMKGVNTSFLSKCCNGLSQDQTSWLQKAYVNLKVIDTNKDKKEVNEEDLHNLMKEGDGFLRMSYVLNSLCISMFNRLNTKNNRVILMANSLTYDKMIPDGAYREIAYKSNNPEGSLMGMLKFLGALIGKEV